MTDLYANYTSLKINRPANRRAGGYSQCAGRNSMRLMPGGHRELAEVWRDIDRDPDTNVVLLRGENGNLSAGGDLGLVEDMTNDFETRARVWKEASDLDLQCHQLLQTNRRCYRRRQRWRRSGCSHGMRYHCCWPHSAYYRRSHPARRRCGRSRRHRVAVCSSAWPRPNTI